MSDISFLSQRIKQIKDCLNEIEELKSSRQRKVNKDLLRDAVKSGDMFLARVAIDDGCTFKELHEIYNKYDLWGWMRFNDSILKAILKELELIEKGNYNRYWDKSAERWWSKNK